MPRPQFTLRALLVAMLVAAAFFGGIGWQRRYGGPKVYWTRMSGDKASGDYLRIDRLTLPDGTRWLRPVRAGSQGRKMTFSENGVTITVEATDESSAP